MKNGIRKRLISSFLLTVSIVLFVLFFICFVLLLSLNSITNSYKTNVNLYEYKELTINVQESMQDYLNLKTYKTIDTYLNNREVLELKESNFNKNPSEDVVKQKEYIVKNLTQSFLMCCDSAVFARRAENKIKAENFYKKSNEAYVLLQQNIDDLDRLYFESNMHNYNNIKNTIQNMTYSSFIIIILTIVFNLFLIYYLVSKIVNPLSDISKSAEQIAKRDFDIPLFVYNKDDEIGNICQAFNKMILSIREYIDTIWEKALEENELKERELKMNELYQDAKLTALQAQINPHFLFNTLNTGAQLAMMEGSDKTCDFLEQVADFYRYNIQYNGQDSDLDNEIKLLESYVYIMKTRFGDKFNFYKDIKIQNLNVRIPGMILQPLVENCIKHGFAGITKGGIIELKVFYKDDYIYITISDNGVGFKNDVSSDKDSGTGVGLSNVISRLKLFYKADNVFEIQKSETGGTKFVIRIQHV